MKRNQLTKLSLLVTFLLVVTATFGQIKVTSSGNVGIGTTSPSYSLEILGQTKISPNTSSSYGLLFDNSGPSGVATLRPSNSGWHGSLGTSSKYFGYSYVDHMYSRLHECQYMRCSDLISNYNYTFSDKTIKNNIKEIKEPFKILSKLEGKTYDETPENFGLNNKKEKKEKKNEYGFIAQEFMEVLPELTKLDTATNLYAINYVGIIPILVEALKDQQEMIETMAKELSSLNTNQKSAFINNSSETIVSDSNLEAVLSQNIPNPFSETTTIEMYIPQTISNAKLYLYNMQGVQIEAFDINNRENTSITIDGFALKAGMYLYTLIADGKEVDTKRMILTK